MARRVYLGKRVKDVKKKGLDTLTEVRGICKSIVNDYKYGRISYRKAVARMNLMHLVVTKDPDFRGCRLKRAKSIIRGYQLQLARIRKEKSGRGRRR